jgi:hypothetical protein
MATPIINASSPRHSPVRSAVPWSVTVPLSLCAVAAPLSLYAAAAVAGSSAAITQVATATPTRGLLLIGLLLVRRVVATLAAALRTEHPRDQQLCAKSPVIVPPFRTHERAEWRMI